jgi:hypothetical protein
MKMMHKNLITTFKRNSSKAFFSIILVACCLTARSQKTDKVKMKNGDTITGEIKNMKLGRLSYDVDGPGVISIKWEEITQVTSSKIFEFTITGGELYVTRIDSLFLLHRIDTLDQIVEIIPIQDKFWSRLSGTLNMGFNFTKANSNLQFNFSSNTYYKVPKVEANLKLNSFVTSNSNDSTTSKKQDAIFNLLRNMGKKFYWGGSAGWQQNTELGIENRYLLSGVLGWKAVADNHNRLQFSGGLSYNQEQSIETGIYNGYLDGLIRAAYKRFYYSTPKLSLDADYTVYPGITESGRIRMQGDLNISVEIFKDFNVGTQFYYSYDNRPPAGSLSNDDYGLVFTLGYSFN